MKNRLQKWGIYRHFKGEYYIVLGIARPTFTGIHNDAMRYRLTAEHVDCDINIQCYNTPSMERNGEYIYDECEGRTDLVYVLYKSLYDDSTVYAREITDFLSEIPENARGKVIPVKYRFNLLQHRVPVTLEIRDSDLVL